MRQIGIASIVVCSLTALSALADEGSRVLLSANGNNENALSQSQREFREKYRIEEQGTIQIKGFDIPDLNNTKAIYIKHSDLNRSAHNSQELERVIEFKHSDLQTVREINVTAFEQQELNVTKLKQDINKTNRNAEALNLFFNSPASQTRIDEQTRFILKDEAFGAYEYAGEYRDIIDDQLKDPNSLVFSSSERRENNNKYLNPNERVIVVISSSMPQSTIRAYFQDIDVIEAPFDVKFVLRGVIGSPETLKPTIEYIASIVSKGDGRSDSKDVSSTGKDSKAERSATADTYRVKIDINPKVTRKYAIDRVPAVIYIKNYNTAIEEPKSLSEAINANVNSASNPNANEEFFIAYGASSLDYSLSKINEQAKSEGLKRLINALQKRGFFNEAKREINNQSLTIKDTTKASGTNANQSLTIKDTAKANGTNVDQSPTIKDTTKESGTNVNQTQIVKEQGK